MWRAPIRGRRRSRHGWTRSRGGGFRGLACLTTRGTKAHGMPRLRCTRELTAIRSPAPWAARSTRQTTFELDVDTYAALRDGLTRDVPLYTRDGNPSQWSVQAKIASLERAESALVFASGMSAIASHTRRADEQRRTHHRLLRFSTAEATTSCVRTSTRWAERCRSSTAQTAARSNEQCSRTRSSCSSSR